MPPSQQIGAGLSRCIGVVRRRRHDSHVSPSRNWKVLEGIQMRASKTIEPRILRLGTTFCIPMILRETWVRQSGTRRASLCRLGLRLHKRSKVDGSLTDPLSKESQVRTLRCRSARRPVLSFWRSREILGICAAKGPRGFSLVQVRGKTLRGMRPNAMYFALRLVTSLTLTT
jgi:hypothetical protein